MALVGSASAGAVIDSHAHWYPEPALAVLAQAGADLELRDAGAAGRVLLVRGNVALTLPVLAGDVETKLRLMDELGIAVQILSLGAVDLAWAGDAAAVVARSANEALAELCGAYPDRFRFLGSVPLGDEAMLAELDRALALGAIGAAITTTVGGCSLDAPEFRPFWRAASRLQLPVAVHPSFPAGGPSGDSGAFLLAGYPGETTVAAARLILSGVLEECPDVRVLWSHVGGGLAMLAGRLNAGQARFPTCPRPPSWYLQQCFFDTVCSHPPALECARATFGSARLVFGTDEPHQLEHPRAILATVEALPWPAAEVTGLLSTNAVELFQL